VAGEAERRNAHQHCHAAQFPDARGIAVIALREVVQRPPRALPEAARATGVRQEVHQRVNAASFPDGFLQWERTSMWETHVRGMWVGGKEPQGRLGATHSESAD
jgi:hypothetical protein